MATSTVIDREHHLKHILKPGLAQNCDDRIEYLSTMIDRLEKLLFESEYDRLGTDSSNNEINNNSNSMTLRVNGKEKGEGKVTNDDNGNRICSDGDREVASPSNPSSLPISKKLYLKKRVSQFRREIAETKFRYCAPTKGLEVNVPVPRLQTTRFEDQSQEVHSELVDAKERLNKEIDVVKGEKEEVKETLVQYMDGFGKLNRPAHILDHCLHRNQTLHD